MNFKQLAKKYSHAVLVIYFLFYMPYFLFLNGYTPTRPDVTILHTGLDDVIPFCEWFAIPYFLWFAYIAAGYIFLLLADRKEFIRLCIFLYTGMTVCLIIYTVFPNGQDLRIDYDTLGRSNILIDWVKVLQAGDSAYDVFPSIHCLNSFGMHIALAKSQKLGKFKKPIVIASFILMVLIVLSTVFLKQHSVVDIYGAVALAVPLYFLAYTPKLKCIK